MHVGRQREKEVRLVKKFLLGPGGQRKSFVLYLTREEGAPLGVKSKRNPRPIFPTGRASWKSVLDRAHVALCPVSLGKLSRLALRKGGESSLEKWGLGGETGYWSRVERKDSLMYLKKWDGRLSTVFPKYELGGKTMESGFSVTPSFSRSKAFGRPHLKGGEKKNDEER